MSRQYSIRELTKELGITARTLRHYEDEGLIAPTRNGQQRIYSARDRARITLILRGRRVGFTLAEIGSLYQPGSPQFQYIVKLVGQGCFAKVTDVQQASIATAQTLLGAAATLGITLAK